MEIIINFRKYLFDLFNILKVKILYLILINFTMYLCKQLGLQLRFLDKFLLHKL